MSDDLTAETRGSWPEHCQQRAFVKGAQWWQFHANGATAFPSERDVMEAEAVRRYGEPVAMSDDLTARLGGFAQRIRDAEDQQTLCDIADELDAALTVERQAREQAEQELDRLRDVMRNAKTWHEIDDALSPQDGQP